MARASRPNSYANIVFTIALREFEGSDPISDFNIDFTIYGVIDNVPGIADAKGNILDALDIDVPFFMVDSSGSSVQVPDGTLVFTDIDDVPSFGSLNYDWVEYGEGQGAWLPVSKDPTDTDIEHDETPGVQGPEEQAAANYSNYVDQALAAAGLAGEKPLGAALTQIDVSFGADGRAGTYDETGYVGNKEAGQTVFTEDGNTNATAFQLYMGTSAVPLSEGQTNWTTSINGEPQIILARQIDAQTILGYVPGESDGETPAEDIPVFVLRIDPSNGQVVLVQLAQINHGDTTDNNDLIDNLLITPQGGGGTVEVLAENFDSLADWSSTSSEFARIVGDVGTDDPQPNPANQALLISGGGEEGESSSAQDIADFFGIDIGALDVVNDGNPANGDENATNGTAIKRAIDVQAGDTLTVRFNFLENEGDGEGSGPEYQDSAFIVIGGQVIRLAQVGDFGTVHSGSEGSFSWSEESGYLTFTFNFTTTGPIQIGFGVMNEGDTAVDAGLLIDQLTVTRGDHGVTVRATDYDGDFIETPLDVVIRDDGPSLTAGERSNALRVDESVGTDAGDKNAADEATVVPPAILITGYNAVIGAATDDGSILFSNVDYGTDGPAANNALVYALVLANGNAIADGTETGLLATGHAGEIALYTKANGVIEGRIGGEGGAVAFALYINPETGALAMAQYMALDHGDNQDHDQAAAPLNFDFPVHIKLTATDVDGDSASAISGNPVAIAFEDDGPRIDATDDVRVEMTLDESRGADASDPATSPTADDSAEPGTIGTLTGSVTGLFDLAGIDFGSDGAKGGIANPQYKLILKNVDGSATSIATTEVATNLSVTDPAGLYADDSIVLVSLSAFQVNGYVGSYDADSSSNVLAFTVQVDPATGALTVSQFLPIAHGTDGSSAADHDDIATLLAGEAGGIFVSATVTDGDGDTATAEAPAALQISFEDDGPKVSGDYGFSGYPYDRDKNPETYNDLYAIIDEDELPEGGENSSSGDDLGFTTATGWFDADFGTDGAAAGGGFSLNVDAGFLTPLKTATGLDLHIDAASTAGSLVVRDSNNALVFTLTLGADAQNPSRGAWNFELHQPLQHKIADTEDNIFLDFPVLVTDGDGDTAATIIKIMVDDDMPWPVADVGGSYVELTKNDLGTVEDFLLANDLPGADGLASIEILYSGASDGNKGGKLEIITDKNGVDHVWYTAPNVKDDTNEVFWYRLTDNDGDTRDTSVTVTVTDRGGGTASVTLGLTALGDFEDGKGAVTDQPAADAADNRLSLPFQLQITPTDGGDTVDSVAISGIPSGAEASFGATILPVSGGSIEITRGQDGGIYDAFLDALLTGAQLNVKLAEHDDRDVTLTMNAVVDGVAVTPDDASAIVDAVAAQPALTDPADQAKQEATPTSTMFTVNTTATFADFGDGSEKQYVLVKIPTAGWLIDGVTIAGNAGVPVPGGLPSHPGYLAFDVTGAADGGSGSVPVVITVAGPANVATNTNEILEIKSLAVDTPTDIEINTINNSAEATQTVTLTVTDRSGGTDDVSFVGEGVGGYEDGAFSQAGQTTADPLNQLLSLVFNLKATATDPGDTVNQVAIGGIPSGATAVWNGPGGLTLTFGPGDTTVTPTSGGTGTDAARAAFLADLIDGTGANIVVTLAEHDSRDFTLTMQSTIGGTATAGDQALAIVDAVAAQPTFVVQPAAQSKVETGAAATFLINTSVFFADVADGNEKQYVLIKMPAAGWTVDTIGLGGNYDSIAGVAPLPGYAGYFTVEIQPTVTGNVPVTFTISGPSDVPQGGLSEEFVIRAVTIDAVEGLDITPANNLAEAVQKVTLTVTDSVPIVNVQTAIKVDEDGLTGANAGANDDGKGDDPQDDSASQTGTFSISSPVDTITAIKLDTTDGLTGLETLDGKAVKTVWDEASKTLVGFADLDNDGVQDAGDRTVFTLAVTDLATRAYKLDLIEPLKHSASNGGMGSNYEDDLNFTVNITVTDDDGSTGTGSVSIVIDDDTPTANNDGVFQVAEDSALVIAGASIFTNDKFGADGVDTGLAGNVTVTNGAKGTVSYNPATGEFTYTPAAGAEGADSFTYTIKDKDGDTSTATVNVNIARDSEPQIGTPSNMTVDEDGLAAGNKDGTTPRLDEEPGSGSTNATGSVVVNFGNDVPVGLLLNSIVLLDTGALDGQLQTLSGGAVTFALEGGALYGRAPDNTLVITISLSSAIAGPNAGEVTYHYQTNLMQPVKHVAGGIENTVTLSGITFEVTDKDGDKKQGNFSASVLDDVPSVTASETQPALTVDETTLLTNASANFASVFTSAFGADGQGAATTYALGISADGANSGLVDVATGLPVTLHMNVNMVEGRVGSTVVFSVTVLANGDVILDQVRAVKHTDANDHDSSVSLGADSLVTLTATITDGDGDTNAATANIGTNLVFKDDGPAISAKAVPVDTLTVDETNFGPNAMASFADNFDSKFGQDGAGVVLYALGITAGPSGLVDTASNQAVVLTLESGVVVGRAGAGGDVVFTVSVDNLTGVVTLNQSRAVVHADVNNPDDSTTLLAANLVKLTATVYDKDGDSAASTIEIGTALNFKDDGPSIQQIADADALIVDETNLATDAQANFADNFSATFGNDQAGSITYALGINAGTSGLIDTATGQAVILSVVGGQVQGRTAISDDLVFTVSVDSAGTVKLDQLRAVVHPTGGASHDEGKQLDAANLITLTATVADKDGDTSSALINIGKALTFRDDGPTAVNDVDSVTEGLTATGNVLTGGTDAGDANTTDGNADSAGADGGATVIAIRTGLEGGSGEGGEMGVALFGQYGKLTINADGTYSYIANNEVPVGAKDYFTYTMRDADGDTDTAQITINLDQNTNIPSAPFSQVTVDEEGLADGTAASGSSETATNSFVINSLDALASLTIGGQAVNLVGGFPQQIIDNAQGTLVINSVTPGAGTYTVGYTYTLKDNVTTHSAPGKDDSVNGPNFIVNVKDITGDTSSGAITVYISDDAPLVTVTKGDESGVILDTQDAQTIGAASDFDVTTKDFSGLFGWTKNAGADGEASSSLTYALGLVSPGVASGLTIGGVGINLFLVGGVVYGSTAASEAGINYNPATGNVVFAIQATSDGTVGLTQFQQIDHGTAESAPGYDDDQRFLADGLVSLTATGNITDKDGDTATDSESIDLGGNIRFDDDGPSLTASASQPTVTVDETTLGAGANKGFAGVFTPNHGADGAGGVGNYVLGIKAPNADSGLVDTATGEAVVLTQVGTTIVGVTQTGLVPVFTISVDAGGNVTLTQHRAVVHPTTDPDEAKQLSADDLITLTATITDKDGDSNTATAQIGLNFTFKDDGPTANNDGTLGITTLNVAVAGTNLLANDNAGADGDKTVVGIRLGGEAGTYTAVGAGGTNILIKADGTEGSPAIGTLHVNADGSWTFTQAAGSELPNLVFSYQMKDKDGDIDTASFEVNLDSLPTITVTNTTPQTAGGEALVDEDWITGGNKDIPVSTGDNAGGASANGTWSTGGSDTPITVTVDGIASGVTATGALALNGTPILWFTDGNTLPAVLHGKTDAAGADYFTLTVNANGTWSFSLLQPVKHSGAGEDPNVILNGVTLKATDADGDPATAQIKIAIDDDMPVVAASGNNIGTTLDETNLAANTGPAPLAGYFTPVAAGADGLGSVVYALTGAGGATFVDGTNSNLVDTATGTAVLLYKDGTNIVGKAGTETVLVISISGDQISFDQQRAVVHADPNNPNDSVSLAGVVYITQTVTDADGDQASATMANPIALGINDDGPTANNDATLAITTLGVAVAGTNLLTNDNAGADGDKTVVGIRLGGEAGAYTAVGVGGTDITIKADGTAGLPAIGTLHVNPDGSWSFTQTAGSELPNLLFSYQMKDKDGDRDTASFEVNLDAVPTITVTNTTPQTAGGEALVDEDWLTGGLQDFTPSTGDNAGGTLASGTWSTNGGDPTVTVTLDGIVNGVTATGASALDGTPILWFAAGSGLPQILHGKTGAAGADYFTLTVNANGTWTFNLLQPVKHTGVGSEDPNVILNSVTLKATDADGDTATAQIKIAIDDDMPVAVNELDQSITTIGVAVGGNVLTNDVGGGDGKDVVTGIKLSTDVSFTNPASGITIPGVGTLTMGANGTWTFTQNSVVASPSSYTFVYEMKDKDGDTATATFKVNLINAAKPAFNDAVALVDEDGLAGGANPNIASAQANGDDKGGKGAANSEAVYTDTVTGINWNGNVGSFALSVTQAQLNQITLADGSSPLLADVTGNNSGNLTIRDVNDVPVINITINASGQYTVTLLQPIKHAGNSTEDNDSIDVTVTATNSAGSTAKVLAITIDDDMPIANPIGENTTGTALVNTNLMLILDISGSMDWDSDLTGNNGSGFLQKIEVARAAVNELLEQYNALGDVMVRIVLFSSEGGEHTAAWMSLTDAKTFLATLDDDGGSTDYDAALIAAMGAFADAGRFGDGTGGTVVPGNSAPIQNISYFISDGQPNQQQDFPGVTYGSGGNPANGSGIQSNEEAAWIAFLQQHDIKSYAIGVDPAFDNNPSWKAALDPIAYDGITNTNNDGSLTITLSNFGQLAQSLVGTIPAINASLLLNNNSFGADGGFVKSLSFNAGASTLTYDKLTNAVSASGVALTASYNAISHILTVTLPEGVLALNLLTAIYVFTPDSALASGVTIPVGFTLVDNDGDTASNTLTLGVLPVDVAPIARDDQMIIADSYSTNFNVEDAWLLWNDTDADGDVVTIPGAITIANTNTAGTFNYTAEGGGQTDSGTVTHAEASGTTLNGSGLDNIIIGDGDNETLNGYEGKDVLVGGGGNDTLNGGEDSDLLMGGAGNDTYVFVAGNGIDRIIEAGGSADIVTLNGILPADVALSQVGNNLKIVYGPAGNKGEIVVEDHFINANKTIEYVNIGGATYIVSGTSLVLPTVTITSAAAVNIAETGGSTIVSFQLSQAMPVAITVNVTYAGSTAGGSDYTTTNAATVTFPAGSTTASLTITASHDVVDDDAEKVVVNLAGGTGYTTTGTVQTQVTIVDDDVPNATPVGKADNIYTNSGNELTIQSAWLTGNDSDGDADPLSVTNVEESSNEFGFEDLGNLPSNFTLDISGMENGETGDYTYDLTDGKATVQVSGGQIRYDTDATLDGSTGNDIIIGVDVAIRGGAGNDIISGQGTNDTLDYSNIAGNYNVTLDASGNGTATADGTDTFFGIENVSAGSGDNQLTGNASANVLSGGAGNDTLNGGDGADTLNGGDGNDTLIGAQNDTLLDGGADNDTLNIGANFADASNAQIANIENIVLTSAITVNLADQTEGLNITGSGGVDSITAGSGADTITGAQNDSLLDGGGGTDTLNIGANFADASNAQIANIENIVLTSAITVNLADQTEGFNITGSAGVDSITGGGGADTINGAQNDSLLDGGGGTDTLNLGANFADANNGQIANIENIVLTSAVTLNLADQTEGFNITGSAGVDSITGGGGADTINGAQNDSLLDGGGGIDTLNLGANFADASNAQIANIENIVLTSAVTLNLADQTEGFNITGSSGVDNITGGAGADVINGGAGADTLLGGAGDDILIYGTGDSIDGGANASNNLMSSSNRGDVMVVSGTVDFTGIGDNFQNIETISMRNADGSTGNSSITLNATDVLQMSDTGTIDPSAANYDLQNALRIEGDATDAVTLQSTGSANWVLGSSPDVPSGYTLYVHVTSGSTPSSNESDYVLIQNGINVTFS